MVIHPSPPLEPQIVAFGPLQFLHSAPHLLQHAPLRGVQLVKGGTRHAILAAVGAHGGGLRWTFGPAAAPTTPGAWHWELGDGTKTMGK